MNQKEAVKELYVAYRDKKRERRVARGIEDKLFNQAFKVTLARIKAADPSYIHPGINVNKKPIILSESEEAQPMEELGLVAEDFSSEELTND